MNRKKIFVISDLHLGGDAGFQMCSNQESLAAFIDWVTAQAKTEKDTEFNLVLAGDIIDFLAEDPWDSFTHSETDALAKLEKVFKNFKLVWTAFKNYVASGAALTILLGNHDVEMSLPRVRRRLLEELGRGGPIEFIYDNEAFVQGDVIIEHGNRYDSWNAIDHNRLREIRSLMSRHQELGKTRLETPGSMFVADVMNDLKKTYNFIDLLKPQNLAVALLLSAFEPERIFSVKEAAPPENAPKRKNILLKGLLKAVALVKPVALGQVVNKSGRDDHFPERRGLISGDLSNKTTEKERFEDSLVAIGFDEKAVEDLKKIGMVAGEDESWGDYTLTRINSFVSLLRVTFGSKDEAEKLKRIHNAFKHLAQVKSYDENNLYVEAATTLGREFKVVVFGHTHYAMRKDLKPTGGKNDAAVYLNSGTWADIISIPEDLLKDESPSDKFKELVDNLKSNKLDELRNSKGSFVEIELDEKDECTKSGVYYFSEENPKENREILVTA